MGGLFDIFRRHFVVLTKFYRNDVKSRPFAARRDPGQRSGPRKPQRGWSGWSWVPGITHGYRVTHEGVGPRLPNPPTPARWASGARFAGWGSGTSARGQWLGSTPPVYPPCIPTLVHPGTPTLYTHPGTPADVRTAGPLGHAHMTVLTPVKENLGV